jgi:hypothetical protein
MVAICSAGHHCTELGTIHSDSKGEENIQASWRDNKAIPADYNDIGKLSASKPSTGILPDSVQI